MANHYRNFLRLLEKWPVDSSKTSRDLGFYIREKLKINFAKGEVGSTVDEDKCNKIFNSLKRISDNHYHNKYQRRFHSSATGLDAKQCNTVLSDEFLEYMKEENEEGIISKVFKKNKKE